MFMVVANHSGLLIQKAHALNDAFADGGMNLQGLEFLAGEFARLEQDRVRYGNLPNVMEQTSVSESRKHC